MENEISELKGTPKGFWLKSWVGEVEFVNICDNYFYRKSGKIQQGDKIVNFPRGCAVEIYEVKPHHIDKQVTNFHCILVPKDKK